MQLPSLPAIVPVLVETSDSFHYGPEHHGIDPATEWWCQANRRTRLGDTRAEVFAPGRRPNNALLAFTTGSYDLDEVEAVGHYAVRIARALAALVADRDDQEAWGALKRLMSPKGPMRQHSGLSWHRALEWLDEARAVDSVADIPLLSVEGWGPPAELWTVAEVAKLRGYTGDAADATARKWLSRRGLSAVGRESGRRGRDLYDSTEVQAAHTDSPGSGRHGAPRGGGGQFAGS